MKRKQTYLPFLWKKQGQEISISASPHGRRPPLTGKGEKREILYRNQKKIPLPVKRNKAFLERGERKDWKGDEKKAFSSR